MLALLLTLAFVSNPQPGLGDLRHKTSRPTSLVIEERIRGPYKTSFGEPDSGIRLTFYEVWIHTRDGKQVWAGTGATPEVAWENVLLELKRTPYIP